MTFDKTNPFPAKIIVREVLNKPGSDKFTMKVVLDITGSGIQYKVGDAIGIYPHNDHQNVQRILRALKTSGDIQVQDRTHTHTYSLETFLTEKVIINRINKKLLTFIEQQQSDSSKKEEITHLLAPEHKELLQHYCEAHELWDLLQEHDNITFDLQALIDLLPPLLPRFYSIASSQLIHKEQIELIISYLDYSMSGHLRYGICSHFVCHLAPMHEPIIPIYLHPAKNFTLPKDLSKPLIMLGPGTGIAPYKGFLEERLATNATGRHWLFFGERRKAYDFYYQDFFEDLEAKKSLRLTYAFSRDAHEKLYVQDKMLEHAEELWTWLKEGAYFYVCGDALRMAKAVDQTLKQIIQEQGQLNEEEAKQYVKQLKLDGRYLRDVY